MNIETSNKMIEKKIAQAKCILTYEKLIISSASINSLCVRFAICLSQSRSTSHRI